MPPVRALESRNRQCGDLAGSGYTRAPSSPRTHAVGRIFGPSIAPHSQGVTQTADLVGPVVKLGHIGDPRQPGPDGAFGTADDIAGCLVCDDPGPYSDPFAWAQPRGQRLGTSTLNQVTGPAATNLDFSLFRAVPVGGNRRLEIRFEANNVLNRPKWGLPTNSVGLETFNADHTTVDCDCWVVAVA